MGRVERIGKHAVVWGLLAVFAWMHYRAPHGSAYSLHMIHREIAFLPIILASFWFGLRWGLASSLAASLIYAPVFFLGHGHVATPLAVLYQVAVFNLVAGVLGHLSDRRSRQAVEIMNAHGLSVLGRAASTLGHEMQELHRAMDLLFRQVETGKPVAPEIRENFRGEMDRLGRMVEVMASYVSEEEVTPSFLDVNQLVAGEVEAFFRPAARKGVRVDFSPDEVGCQAVTREEPLRWVVKNLLENAMEYTPPQKGIFVETRRGADSCEIIVRDQGPGIPTENLPRIFSPFFTTRKNGHGIKLAACRKVMRDLGGDLAVESPPGKGAAFTLRVPRDDP
ncbi:MAG: HAMP domain-containing histidine kinase, partial [Proteobacteria bacterium]|nr:HAMP domain-containing histidine kinase [Pseudomonadota bacterium]